MFIVSGAPPMLQLRPLFDRLSLTPGMTLNDCRNLYPIYAILPESGICGFRAETDRCNGIPSL
jgi:hypothetical protein